MSYVYQSSLSDPYSRYSEKYPWVKKIGDYTTWQRYVKAIESNCSDDVNDLFVEMCGEPNIDVFLYLINNKRDIIDYNYNDDEPFIEAAKGGNLNIILLLWKNSKKKIDIHVNNDEAFIEACGNIDIRLIKWFFEKDNFCNKSIIAGFEKACRYRCYGMMEYLHQSYPKIITEESLKKNVLSNHIFYKMYKVNPDSSQKKSYKYLINNGLVDSKVISTVFVESVKTKDIVDYYDSYMKTIKYDYEVVFIVMIKSHVIPLKYFQYFYNQMIVKNGVEISHFDMLNSMTNQNVESIKWYYFEIMNCKVDFDVNTQYDLFYNHFNCRYPSYAKLRFMYGICKIDINKLYGEKIYFVYSYHEYSYENCQNMFIFNMGFNPRLFRLEKTQMYVYKIFIENKFKNYYIYRLQAIWKDKLYNPGDGILMMRSKDEFEN